MRRSVVFALLLAGCTSTPPDLAKPPTIQAENPEWSRIAEEAMRGRPVEEQQRMLEAERRYQLALAWFNRGDFDKAKVEAQIAVQTWTEHIPARRLLDDVNEIIVGGPTRIRGIGDQDLQVCRVTVEQVRIEIENHILLGRRHQAAGMHAAAVRDFEDAEFKIRKMPFEVKSMNDLLPGLKELKARSKSSLKD